MTLLHLLEYTENEWSTENLLKCFQSKESLDDLHTHLLGMGNAKFWIENILTDRRKLPTQNNFINSDSLRRQLGPLIWDEDMRQFNDPENVMDLFDGLRSSGNFKHSFYENLTTPEFKQKKEHHGLSFQNNFSYDVVFSLDNLVKGLGLNKKEPREINQGKVEEKLGIYTRSDWEKRDFFKNWIIFNARYQKLQVIYGIKAEHLRMLIGGEKTMEKITDLVQQNARAHIINAFSMMNADGSEPRSVDFHSFRGAFTPEFYPRRFALKDSLYEQRLDLLAYLLVHALGRYSGCSPPVKYCEISVGCGDLSRPWIFDVLTTFSHNTEHVTDFQTRLKNFPWLQKNQIRQDMRYRFLAGFKREIPPIIDNYSADEAVVFLFELPHYAIYAMFREFSLSDNGDPTIIFKQQVEDLQKMKKESQDIKGFYHWVVGLDLCGDELGHPYCPFIAHEFIKFVQEIRREKRTKNFGIRIHAGENVPFVRPELPGYRLFVAHMYILFRCIHFLKMKLGKNIRVGHGVAFDKLLSIENYKYRKSSILVAEMKRYAKSVFSDIPFEVNITSNLYLLGDAVRNAVQEEPLSHLRAVNVKILLSTDNDGIWPIDKCDSLEESSDSAQHSVDHPAPQFVNHSAHYSLAAEYCDAIKSHFISTKIQLDTMIDDSKKYRFCNRSESASTCDGIKRDYFPADVIVHPNVLDMLFKKELSPIVESYHFLKYYENIYKTQDFPTTNNNINYRKYYYEVAMRILMACFYLRRSLSYQDFEKEYEKLSKTHQNCKTDYKDLFSEKGCIKVYTACKHVYLTLMNDAQDEGANLKVSIDDRDYLFCSEIPNERKTAPYLLSTIETFIRECPKPATIFSFISNIDDDSQEMKTTLDTINRKIEEKPEIKIFIHTNTKKDMVYPSIKNRNIIINATPEQRTDAEEEEIECVLLYAVCPHGSVATCALNFIAKHIHKESFSIEQ
ncbi:unnamed protein product [Rotaria socialis]|uniref:Adenosine deaminase domain-containing protein n=1 Tax=Rotaria socialis TaxID=392032 RepID=A0A821TLR7_9BILA|nr:unnamed protein product [Rotaria socialis]CAF4877502.1 unnamed protein product [Rotaria socialis]